MSTVASPASPWALGTCVLSVHLLAAAGLPGTEEERPARQGFLVTLGPGRGTGRAELRKPSFSPKSPVPNPLLVSLAHLNYSPSYGFCSLPPLG